MTPSHDMASAGTEVAREISTPALSADAVLAVLNRWQRRELADDGPLWHGIGEIRQALGQADKEALRGTLIELVARGDVEASDCANGVFWRAHYERPAPTVEVADGHFILQREIREGGRTNWFDAETYTNSKRAAFCLRNAKEAAQHHARNFGERAQGIRLVSLVTPK